MTLPIVNEDWIEKQWGHSWGNRPKFERRFKSIVVQGPDIVYVRFGLDGEGHNHIADKFFYDELSAELECGRRQFIDGYERKGGAYVSLIKTPDEAKLYFRPGSERLKACNPSMLEQALKEGLSDKYTYEIH